MSATPARTSFWAICHALWRNDGEATFNGKYLHIERGQLRTPFIAPGRIAPEIYVAGDSEQERQLALDRGSCWMRLIDTPEKLQPQVAAFRERGVKVGLRLCVILPADVGRGAGGGACPAAG